MLPSPPAGGGLRARLAHPIVSGAAARAASMLPTALATLAISRLVLDTYGVRTFNGYALVISTIMLLPLNNLGTGAAVTRAVATDGPLAPRSERVVLTAARTLSISSLVVATVSLLVGAAGLWPTILGPEATTGGAFGLAVAAYALGFVPGLAQSVLLGVNRNHVTIVVQTFWLPSTLVVVAVAAAADAPSGAVLVAPALMLTANAVATAWISGRLTGFSWRRLVARLPRRRRFPGARIRAMAGPALLVNLSVPIALQSDRLVLSHVSTDQQLAGYSIAWQIFAPVVALLGAAAQPLWPMFASAEVDGREPPDLRKVVAAFVALATAACAVLVLVADDVGALIGADRVHLGVALPLATALVVVVQAVAHPMAMALMDPEGLRLVAACSVAALPLNVGLSIALAGPLGAPGPLLASAAVGLVVQVLPGAVLLHRRHGRPVAERVAVLAPGDVLS